jgi:hypothetical protein
VPVSRDDRLPATVARLTSDVSSAERRVLLRRLAGAIGSSARTAGLAGVGSGRWLVDLVVQTAPHLPIRDLATLQQHYGPIRGDALADALIRNASRASAGIGLAGGALAAVEWTAPPALLTTPVQLAAETLAVIAVEIKLIAELQEAYGKPVDGTAVQRATAYLTAWARGRGVDPIKVGAQFAQSGLASAISHATKRELRDRVLKRLGRNLSTLGPIFTGAAVGAELNRRATRGLGEAVRRDLAKQVKQGARR